MLQISSSKFSAKRPKLAIQIHSPVLSSQPMPRTPVFSRKGNNLRREKGAQSLKSSGEKSVQKSLRYTKIIPQYCKDDVSEVHSEVHIIKLLTEDSRETVVQRGRSQSHQKQTFLYPRIKSPKPKSPGRKVFEQFAAMNESSRKSRINHKNEEHYIYWKNKAYQYLESNIKLMDQVRKLARENEDLKSSIAELQQNKKDMAPSQEGKIYTEKTLSIELRNMSAIYINKIESMEKQLKYKEILITSYQLKLKDMNARLAGDNQRIKLIQRLREDIERLKMENYQKNIEPQKLEHNYYASTSILLSQNGNR